MPSLPSPGGMPLSIRVTVTNLLKCIRQFPAGGTLEACCSELTTSAEEMSAHSGGTESQPGGQRGSCQRPALREEFQYLYLTVSEIGSDAGLCWKRRGGPNYHRFNLDGYLRSCRVLIQDCHGALCGQRGPLCLAYLPQHNASSAGCRNCADLQWKGYFIIKKGVQCYPVGCSWVIVRKGSPRAVDLSECCGFGTAFPLEHHCAVEHRISVDEVDIKGVCNCSQFPLRLMDRLTSVPRRPYVDGDPAHQ